MTRRQRRRQRGRDRAGAIRAIRALHRMGVVLHCSSAEMVRYRTAGLARDMQDRSIGRVAGKPIRWDKKAVHNLLRRRWYVGEIQRTDGTWHPAHEGIVDRATWDDAQRAMDGRRKGGRTPSDTSRTMGWLLRGLASCVSCGSRMGAAYSRTDSPRGYYACCGRMRGTECDEPYVRVEDADGWAAAATVVRLEKLRDLLSKAKPLTRVDEDDADRAVALVGSLEAAKVRRQRAVSLAVDGVMSREELQMRLAKIDEEISRLESKIAETGRKTRLADLAVRAERLADVVRLRRTWERLDVAGQRAVLQLLSERISLGNGGVAMVWKSAESLGQATGGESLFGGTDAVSPRPRLHRSPLVRSAAQMVAARRGRLRDSCRRET